MTSTAGPREALVLGLALSLFAGQALADAVGQLATAWPG